MLNYFKALSVFLIWAIIALTIHYFIASRFLNEEIIKPSKKAATVYAVTNYKNDTLFSFDKAFEVQKNSSKILNINDFTFLFDSITSYLKNHYDNKLIITGLYSDKENVTKKNIGLLRAKEIAAYFQNSQIDAYQLKIYSEFHDNLFKSNNNTSGITLKINSISTKTSDSITKKISNKRIYVDFENNQLIENMPLEKYVKLLKQYLKKHPHKTIYITGHTDNNGYYQNNLIIGLNRANLVKNYFKINGIENANIITSSKGESEPIADKNTLDGKAKNRRIEIKIN
jgi:flagellar motor protein MotB